MTDDQLREEFAAIRRAQAEDLAKVELVLEKVEELLELLSEPEEEPARDLDGNATGRPREPGRSLG